MNDGRSSVAGTVVPKVTLRPSRALSIARPIARRTRGSSKGGRFDVELIASLPLNGTRCTSTPAIA